MNNRQTSHLKRATEIAKHSSCNFRHGVVIAIGPRVLAVAVNTHRNYGEVCGVPLKEMSFHAERNALKQLEGRDLSRAVLYSARVGKDGKALLAKPCPDCWELIKAAGIRKVCFTK